MSVAARIFFRAVREHGKSQAIQVYNGLEFISKDEGLGSSGFFEKGKFLAFQEKFLQKDRAGFLMRRYVYENKKHKGTF